MLGLLLFISNTFASPSLVMSVGQSVRHPAAGRVFVDRSGIIQVREAGSSIVITARKVGSSQFRTGERETKVRVLPKRQYQTYQKLGAWLEDKRGLWLSADEAILSLRGEWLSFSDWFELFEITSPEDEFQIQARPRPEVESQLREKLQSLSQENHLVFSEISFQPLWTLTISDAHKGQLPEYRRVFSPGGLRLTTSSQALQLAPLVEISVLAAEIKRHEMSQLGITWPAKTQMQLIPRWGLDPNSVLVNIEHLESSGTAKVLASPTLLAQSGEEATFHAGGEMPIKTSNQFNAGVIWKKYGILLKIKPKADARGRMDIFIDCEVSALDSASPVDGVPGVLINRISSHFNLNESRTIALSGLIREDWSRARSGLPGLSQIPLFSTLFSSENYRKHQSELIFFVTPRIRP